MYVIQSSLNTNLLQLHIVYRVLEGWNFNCIVLCPFSTDATPQSITPAKKYSQNDGDKTKDKKKGGITIAAARYSSEDAASLVAFIVAIVEYTRLCVPLKQCQKKLSDLEREKEDLIVKEEQSKMVSVSKCRGLCS